MRKIGLLMLFIFLTAFTGCSATFEGEVLEPWLEKQAAGASGIVCDENYLQFKEWQEDGKLDETGHYNEWGEYAEWAVENPENGTEQKEVRVSFASNSYLTIDYFYDKNKEKRVEGTYGYFNPGESIYATQPQCNNPYTNAYTFAGYRIYEYDSDGKRGQLLCETGNIDKVYTIPLDFKGTELSVEPIGEYQRREVLFHAYKVDENGNQVKVSGGRWLVNDEEYRAETAHLNPSDAYIVKYCYDSDEYYVVDTQPKFFALKDGEVEFQKATPIDENDSYSVQLSKWLEIALGDDKLEEKIATIQINGNDCTEQSIKDKSIKHLKVNDSISIVTKEGYRLFCSQLYLGTPELLAQDSKCHYEFKVSDSGEEMCIRVSKTEFRVNVKSNVGNDIWFNIEGTSFPNKSGLVYEKNGWFGFPCQIVKETIGAEEFILISAEGNVIPEGYALRFDVTKEDNNKQDSEDILYLATIPGQQKIAVYENGTAANISKVYTDIEVDIDLVEVMRYTQEEVANGTVRLFYADEFSDKEIREGDYIEGSRKVQVILQSEDGYYVAGKKVEDDDSTYEVKIKYEEYDLAKLLEEHPIKKKIQVTLDTADAYGICVFKVDGKEESGEVVLQEGQQITLEYTLTDSDYQIVRETEGFWGGIKDWGSNTFNKDKESVTIEVTQELDGTVITRESSLIKVEKR